MHGHLNVKLQRPMGIVCETTELWSCSWYLYGRRLQLAKTVRHPWYWLYQEVLTSKLGTYLHAPLLGDSTPRKLRLRERPVRLSVCRPFTVSNQLQHSLHFAHQFGPTPLTNTRDSSILQLPRACGIIGRPISFLLNGNQLSCFPFVIVTHWLLALFSPRPTRQSL